MKSAVFLFILASLLSFSFAQTERPESDEQKAGFLGTMILRSLESLTEKENRTALLKAEYNNSIHCLATSRANISFCNVFTNHFIDCTKKFVETIEASVEHRRTGLANALVTSLVAQVSFMCNTDGEHVFEIFNPCVLKTFIFHHTKGEEEKCMRHFMDELNSAVYKQEGTIISSVCKALPDAKNCIKGPFEANCPNPITRNTIEELYNTNIKVCNVA